MTAPFSDTDLQFLSLLAWRDGRRPELAEKIDAARRVFEDTDWVPPYVRIAERTPS